MAVTRAQLSCSDYGIRCELTARQLASVKDVLQYYFFLQTQLPEIVVQVPTIITDIWINSGIPTVSKTRVERKVESLHETLRMILKRNGEGFCSIAC